MGKEMKKFVGVFKVQNGEAEYKIMDKVECQMKKEAIKSFKAYEKAVTLSCYDAWRLEAVEEVKTFDDLWRLIQSIGFGTNAKGGMIKMKCAHIEEKRKKEQEEKRFRDNIIKEHYEKATIPPPEYCGVWKGDSGMRCDLKKGHKGKHRRQITTAVFWK